MKFDLTKREMEVSINAIMLAIGAIDEDLKKESILPEYKEELKKDREVLAGLVRRLTIPLITMD